MERKWNDGPESLAEMTVQLRPLLFAAIRQIPLDDDAVEDVLQQTWILYLRHRSGIRNPHAVRSWLWTTARRVAIREANVTRREMPVADIDERRLIADEGLIDELTRRASRAALWEAVATLPRREQYLIDLLVQEPRLSYRQIAGHLGVSPQSIGQMRTRCLRTLRTRLAQLGVTSF